MNPVRNIKIIRYKDGKFDECDDIIAVEAKLRLYINEEEILSISATPSNIRELITGFLMTEGILKGEWCPEKISIETDRKEIKAKVILEGFASLEGKTITSGCLASVSFIKELKTKIVDDLKVEAHSLFSLFREFQLKSQLYRETGCVHSAAIADKYKILFLSEDVGRHNAVDKVIGWALLNKVSFAGKIILVSGRVSSEMALKVAKWKIPIIVSRAAPTSLAVELANSVGLTVIGFLRGNRFNVYSNPQRIGEYEQK